MGQPPSRRKRGVVLTHRGIERLKAAIQAAEFNEKDNKRFTLEDLSDRIRIAPKTVSRVLEGTTALDKSTLTLCFEAFGIALEPADYGHPPEDSDPLPPTQNASGLPVSAVPVPPQTPAEFPGGPIPLGSPFYIERPPLEALGCAEIGKPGALVRIRAAQKMGKTSLMQRIVAYGQGTEGYHAVQINLQQADRTTLSSLDKLLRWLCVHISRQLQQPVALDAYWDDDMGSKMSATLYLQEHVLSTLEKPLILVLENLHRVFEYDHLSHDFLILLRSWYEEAAELQLWQRLRLILVHSTEVYVPLKLDQSPFNVGLPLRLPDLTLPQVAQLAQTYGLSRLSDAEVAELTQLVGGHPYLLSIAFFWLSQGNLNLPILLTTATTLAGIYSSHLRDRLSILLDQPELLPIMRRLVEEPKPLRLIDIADNTLQAAVSAYKLESLGFVKLAGNDISVSCELYRLYFREQFLDLS